MSETIGRGIDPEVLGEEVERSLVERGGGGGGKKNKKRQGEKTRGQMVGQMVVNAEANREAEEDSELLNPRISAVLESISGADETYPKLPILRRYILWVSECLKPDSELSTDEALAKGLRFEAVASGGPGGQNTNKTASKVRMWHVYTGMRTVNSETRDQVQNRAACRKALLSAITHHLGEWRDLVGGTQEGLGDAMAEVLEMHYEDKFGDGTAKSANKRDDLKDICGVLRAKDKKVVT